MLALKEIEVRGDIRTTVEYLVQLLETEVSSSLPPSLPPSFPPFLPFWSWSSKRRPWGDLARGNCRHFTHPPSLPPSLPSLSQAFKDNTIDTSWLDGLIREKSVRVELAPHDVALSAAIARAFARSLEEEKKFVENLGKVPREGGRERGREGGRDVPAIVLHAGGEGF